MLPPAKGRTKTSGLGVPIAAAGKLYRLGKSCATAAADFRIGGLSLVGASAAPASHPWDTNVDCSSVKYASGLLAVALLTFGGCCAQLHQSQDPCACSMSEYDLGCALDQLCKCDPLSGCGCPVGSQGVEESAEKSAQACVEDCGEDCTVCEESPTCCESDSRHPAGCRLRCGWRPGCNVQPGPPPVTYRPVMPPEFLPVPTQPIFAAVNLATPEPTRGNVEVDFGPQLQVPGGD